MSNEKTNNPQPWAKERKDKTPNTEEESSINKIKTNDEKLKPKKIVTPKDN